MSGVSVKAHGILDVLTLHQFYTLLGTFMEPQGVLAKPEHKTFQATTFGGTSRRKLHPHPHIVSGSLWVSPRHPAP